MNSMSEASWTLVLLLATNDIIDIRSRNNESLSLSTEN